MGSDVEEGLGVADLIIFVLYLIFVTGIGIWYQKKSQENVSSFFLGGNSIPWWMLSFSGMSSNLDVSGTMINCAMIYVFGVSGFFVELRGGITLMLAFLLVFTGKWARRSKVFTIAEWMIYRFGPGRGGDSARIAIAVLSLISSVFQITYFAVGSGKFAAEFLGLSNYLGIPEDFWAAMMMVSIAMIYTLASGLHGVVVTDVAQSGFIFVIVIYACFRSFQIVSLPSEFTISFPLTDPDPITGLDFQSWNTTRKEWTNIQPKWKTDYPDTSSYSSLNDFGLALIFYSIRSIAEGMGGGSNPYMMQRYFALSDDIEVIKMTFLWICLLSFRWAFIMSLTLMGVQYGIDEGEAIEDPERLLPVIVLNSFPVVAKGLALAGFTAAAMSTFDSVVNAGSAYWVIDIYQAFINPEATEMQLMRHSRASCILIVFIGLLFSLALEDVNTVWSFLQFSIFGASAVPLMVRWYWEGCTAYAFTSGICVGLVFSMIMYTATDLSDFVQFFLNIIVGLIVVITVSKLTPKVEGKVLQNFYETTRPMGFWRETRLAFTDEFNNIVYKENISDCVGIVFAVAFQLSLFSWWMTLIEINEGGTNQFLVISGILIFSSLGLYFFWLKASWARAVADKNEERENNRLKLEEKHNNNVKTDREDIVEGDDEISLLS